MRLWEINSASADLNNVGTSKHKLSILATANYGSEEILSFITVAFEKLGTDFHIKIVEKRDHPSMFAQPARTVVLEVRNALASLSLSEIYRTAFSATNLLNARSVRIVKGELVSVESSNLIFDLVGNLQFADVNKRRTDIVLLCNDKIERIERIGGIEFNPRSKLDQCEKWAAISSAILHAHAASLTGQTTAKLFVAPFALSSLSVTLLVYTLYFLIIYASGVGALLPKLASNAFVKIEEIPLTYAACIVFVFFIVPLTALVFVFL
jgi:hypothetical protein